MDNSSRFLHGSHDGCMISFSHMNKTTTTIIVTAVIALAVGLCFGSVLQRGGGWGKGEHRMYMGEKGMRNGMGGEMYGNRMMGDGMGSSTGMMGGMMKGMMMGLDGKTGDAFDQAFLSEMIVHHQGAVEMAESALVNAKHQEIKDMAKAIIDAQNKEIAQMQGWEKAWYSK
jgi:hypothetical protein